MPGQKQSRELRDNAATRSVYFSRLDDFDYVAIDFVVHVVFF